MEMETDWPNQNNGYKIHSWSSPFFIGFITLTKDVPNFKLKKREMNFAWHREGLFLMGRSIWKKIGLERKSEILVKFDERNCSNSTFKWKATLSSEKQQNHNLIGFGIEYECRSRKCQLIDQIENL